MLRSFLSWHLSNAPKYRLVVRFTNKEIIVQIVYARLQGDFVLTAARSKELPRYGINHGLTNWTAGKVFGTIRSNRVLTARSLCNRSTVRSSCANQAWSCR